MIPRKRWGYRIIKSAVSKRWELEILIAGKLGRIAWDPCFDKRGTGSRAVLTAGFDIGNRHYSIMGQHYREGYTFDVHKDGVVENKVITFLLHRPKLGGEFFVCGPLRSWCNGRITTFDGGRYDHGVTQIIRGSRTVLMVQRGRWR